VTSLRKRVSALDDLIDHEVDEGASGLNVLYVKRLKARRDQLKAKIAGLAVGEDRRFTQQTVRAASIRTSILRNADDLDDISKKWQSALRRVASKIEDRFKVSDERKGKFSRDDHSIITALIGAQNKTGYIGKLIETDAYHRRVLADALTRHVIGRNTPEQLIGDIERLTKRSQSESRRLFHDSAQSFSRTVTLSKAKKLGYKKFQYLGPEDGANRPFCAKHVDKVYTREEIDALSNGQKMDVWTYAGGYNCRHSWRPVRASWFDGQEDEVSGEEAPGEEESKEEQVEEVKPKAKVKPKPKRSIADRNLEILGTADNPSLRPYEFDPTWSNVQRIENGVARAKLEAQLSDPKLGAAIRRMEQLKARGRFLRGSFAQDYMAGTGAMYDTLTQTRKVKIDRARELADAIDYSMLGTEKLQRATRAVCVEFFGWMGDRVDVDMVKKINFVVDKDRGYFNRATGQINLGRDGKFVLAGTKQTANAVRSVVYHELGHALEHYNKGLGADAIEYLKMASKKAEEVYDITEGRADRPEWGLRGAFSQPYTSRLYTRQFLRNGQSIDTIKWDWLVATEITSMGMEGWTSKIHFNRLAFGDPDVFWWTIALQKGLI
jgi:hypothetical protein